MKLSTKLLLLFLLVSWTGFLYAAANDSHLWLPKAEKQLKRWQNSLGKWQKAPPTLPELEDRQNEIFNLKQKTDDCVADFTGQIDSLLEKLTALGEAVADEAQDLKKRRLELSKSKQSVETELAVCRLLNLSIRDLQDEHKAMRNKLLSQALSHREQPIWETLLAVLKKPAFFVEGFQFKFSVWPAILAALTILLILVPLARYVSELLMKKYPTVTEDKAASDTTLFVGMLARRLPWIAMLASLVIFAYLGEATLVGAMLLALLISLLLAPLLELLICQGVNRCQEGLPARILMDIVLIGAVAHFAGLRDILVPDSFKLLQVGYYLLLMVCSLWLLLLLSKRQNFQFVNSIRTPVAVAIISGPLAMWLGFQSLSELLMPGVYGTLAGFLVAWVLYQAGRLFFAMFEPDEPQSNTHLRQFLGYEDQELIPGLWIGRLLLAIAIVVGFTHWLLITWSIPHSEINAIGAYFTDGFSVGAITIVPSKIITAIMAFFLFLTLARWLRNQLSERWLQRTRLDSGAKESIVSLTTYAIVGLALVIALGMAGVDFQNVAIVAGALSVGIGFGLQNIVNNFVSGLILLFERPVKPGDWVEVGSTEGYVKKISIRYTLIQTFDRADVMVPNSELISSQVTNWMLRDSMGRVIVPVGVAYGSDTKLVREILYRVAANHAFVLVNDWRVHGPKVLFIGFGDSALEFEIRCFIKDIDYKLSVRSDLLFAIDEEFRNAGIEIPFPQRVVHMPNSEPTVTNSNSTEHDED